MVLLVARSVCGSSSKWVVIVERYITRSSAEQTADSVREAGRAVAACAADAATFAHLARFLQGMTRK
jgi:hypothetical protein